MRREEGSQQGFFPNHPAARFEETAPRVPTFFPLPPPSSHLHHFVLTASEITRMEVAFPTTLWCWVLVLKRQRQSGWLVRPRLTFVGRFGHRVRMLPNTHFGQSALDISSVVTDGRVEVF
jgi:hypothetical protein